VLCCAVLAGADMGALEMPTPKFFAGRGAEA